MSDVKINLDELESLSSRLKQVSGDLDHAEAFSSGVAGVVGDERLASVLRDFAAKWNIRRQDLIEQIEITAAAAQAIHDTFEELDREIAKSISTPGAKTAVKK
jgi:hypothetical protein